MENDEQKGCFFCRNDKKNLHICAMIFLVIVLSTALYFRFC